MNINDFLNSEGVVFFVAKVILAMIYLDKMELWDVWYMDKIIFLLIFLSAYPVVVAFDKILKHFFPIEEPL
jgi:hypothetical protein